MNERIRELAEQCTVSCIDGRGVELNEIDVEKFTELIVRECIDKIETHRIPVGNSRAGEMACEWTYNALKEIRDEIKEHFGLEK